MKQHIRVEQLNELSEKGKENLRKFIVTRKWDVLTISMITPKSRGEIVVNNDIPLLSIGQMIEFLDAQEYQDIEKIEKSPIDWIVWINDKEFIEIGKDKKRGKQQNELCDALWEAVKQILNEPTGKSGI